MNELDIIWNRLINYRLSCAQNQSIIENHLPFGMRRQLKPLRFSRQLLDMKHGPPFYNKFAMELKDPWMALNHREPLILKPKPLSDPNNTLGAGNKIKFIQHKIVSNCSSCVIDDMANGIKFDPTVLLFFKDDIASNTNITSNANGTVSCDKNHLGAILKQGCWLVSMPDLLSFPCSNLPQTMNNKLRGIKFAEFLSQEWNNMEGFGEKVEFIAINQCENGTMKILSSKRTVGNGMCLFIINPEGQVKKRITSHIKANINDSNLIYQENVNVEVGDLIVLIKSKGSEEEVLGITEMIRKTSFCIEDDMESKMISMLKGFKGINCLLISKVHFNTDFDMAFVGKGLGLKYNCHLDTKMGSIVNEPIPISFGCTTRHSVIFREGYFGALHHDASKINRFPDTINYIIRKLCNPTNLGRRLEQEGDESVLKRISDIQYFAYVINWKDKILLGLGGGAKCILLSDKDCYVNLIKIYEMPILIDISKDLMSEGCDEGESDQGHLILLSPHFPTFLIKSIQGACSIKEFMNELLILSGVDAKSFKVSMAHFTITTKEAK